MRTPADTVRLGGPRYVLDCPAFRNLKIPVGYVPATDRWDALDALWDAFRAHPRNAAVEDGMDLDRILSDHTRTDVNGLFFTRLFSGTLGEATNPDQQFGRHMWCLRLALSFLARFSDLIPNDGTCCPDMGTKVQNALENNTYDIWLQGKDGVFNPCGDAWGDAALQAKKTGFTFKPCGAASLVQAFPQQVGPNGSTALAVAMCAEYVDFQSYALDRTMYLGYLAWSYPQERTSLAGDVDAASYELAYRDLGRLGLGAVLVVARTILHELIHRITVANHCGKGCCMQRIALKWQCRVAAECGAWALDANSTDTSLLGLPFRYASQCKAGQGESVFFKGGCEMHMPGTPGRTDGWYKTGFGCLGPGCAQVSDWTNPAECPTCP